MTSCFQKLGILLWLMRGNSEILLNKMPFLNLPPNLVNDMY